MKRVCSFFLTIVFIAVLFNCQTTRTHIDKGDLFYLVEIGDLDTLKGYDAEALSVVNNEGLTLLHAAMMYNKPEIAEYLIEQGATIEANDNYSRTPLLLAMYVDSFEAVKVLTKNNANIFASDYDKNTPFSYSIDKHTYKQLLTKQNVLQKDSSGLIPLDYAKKLGDKELIDYITSLMPVLKKKVAKRPLEKAKVGEVKKEAVPDNPYATRAAVEKTVAYLLSGGKPFGAEFSEFEQAALRRNFNLRFSDGNMPLHYAARRGQTGIVDFLLSKAVNINAKNLSNSTALHEAVRNGHIEVVKLLLKAKADPNACDANGNTPLHLVMPKGSRDALITELLKYVKDLNAQDNYGETPLHIAARIGMSDELIKKLVNAGADLNERNKKGQSPLMLALERKNFDQVKTFINLGANIHDEDNEGLSSFVRALDMGLNVVKLIINKRNISLRDSSGRTPLHIAAIKNSNIEILTFLLDSGSEVNTRDKDGNSPLHSAVKNNYKDMGVLFLEKSADIFVANNAGDSALKLGFTLAGGREDWLINNVSINSRDSVGNTPLHLAAEWNLPNMMLYLLKRGANINAKNDNGESPFFSSMKGNSPEGIDVLLKYPDSNIDIFARDFLGNSVLHTAVQWSAYEAAQKVFSLKGATTLVTARNLAGETALHMAASKGSLRFIQMLLKYGSDVNESDELGRTALIYAINAEQDEALRYLLSENASPIQQDIYGKTPLHIAVENKNVDCAKILQEAGARAMIKDYTGASPLTLALKQSNNMLSAVLGANKNIQDSDGQSPLHIAVLENVGVEKLNFLLDMGFPINKRNRNGDSCLLLAVQLKRSSLISLLLKKGANAFLANNRGESPISLVLTDQTEFLDSFSENMKDSSDAMGDTILHYAARLSTADTVLKLLKAGHDANRKNLEGQTALDVANRWSNQDVQAVFKRFADIDTIEDFTRIKE